MNISVSVLFQPFKRQFHKMVKHIVSVVFDHFLGLALKGLTLQTLRYLLTLFLFLVSVLHSLQIYTSLSFSTIFLATTDGSDGTPSHFLLSK